MTLQHGTAQHRTAQHRTAPHRATRRRTARRLLSVGVGAAALATTVIATSGAAEAAPTAVEASAPTGSGAPLPGPAVAATQVIGSCGAGYSLVWSAPLTEYGTGAVGGSADLYWSNASGQNCLIVRATGPNYGSPNLTIEARLELSGNHEGVSDYGDYRYYAGPVYLAARNHCVAVTGDITNGNGHEYSVQNLEVACT